MSRWPLALACLALTAGCATVDTIRLPRTRTAYVLGGLEIRLRDACRAGVIDTATCGELKRIDEGLQKLLFAPPPSPLADGEILMEFLEMLGSVTGHRRAN